MVDLLIYAATRLKIESYEKNVLQVYEKILFHISSFMFFLPSFSQNVSRLFFTKGIWKCLTTISFRKLVH